MRSSESERSNLDGIVKDEFVQRNLYRPLSNDLRAVVFCMKPFGLGLFASRHYLGSF